MRASTWIFGVSVAAHAALGVGVGSLHSNAAAHGATAISVADAKKKKTPPKPDTPPPLPKPLDAPNAPRQRAKAKVAAFDKPPPDAPAPAAAQAAAMDALPDFGLSLSGGVGPGGIAVPAGAGGPREGPSAKASPKPAAAAPKPTLDDCSDAPTKPKAVSVPQPAYTPAARDANVQGKVRVEVSVDAQGHVTNARLISGLGYGLDEAALAAARAASFTPGSKCGRAAAATFVIAMRFSL